MKRMSPLDAAFLEIEDANAHMQIAGLCVFAGPAPDLAELRELIGSRLHHIERYRQRVRNVPFELGRPVWVDDQDFSIERHVRQSSVRRPGDARALERLVGRLLSEPLDHDHPLWEARLVLGLRRDRWAIIYRAHHCMVDGIGGVELLSQLLDTERTVTIETPPPWRPRAAPSGTDLVVDAWKGLAGDSVEWMSQLPSTARHPFAAAREGAELLCGTASFLRHLSLTPRSPLNGVLGPDVAWASTEATMADVAAIRHAFGGTVNDVVLAAVAGGYRSLLLSLGQDPARSMIRSMIPVSVRNDGHAAGVDNRVSTLLYELPVSVVDPVARLHTVSRQMADLKATHMAESGALVTSMARFAPPMLVETFLRMAVRAEHVVAQRVVNTVTTNVPGPQFPLYCLGREMLQIRPVVPITHGVRMATAILSYNGNLFFGVTADEATEADATTLADAIAASIRELRARADSGARSRPIHPKRAVPARTARATRPKVRERSVGNG